MNLTSVLLAFFIQGKVAPVEAVQLTQRSAACIVVRPDKGDHSVTVTRLIWGSGLKPGDRIRLKGYVFRDYRGFPNEKKLSDYMSYRVDRPSLVFLESPPKGVSLSLDERFAEWPVIGFTGSRHDCSVTSTVENHQLRSRQRVGGVLFSPSMKHSQRDSVSLDEVIIALKRIRAGLGH